MVGGIDPAVSRVSALIASPCQARVVANASTGPVEATSPDGGDGAGGRQQFADPAFWRTTPTGRRVGRWPQAPAPSVGGGSDPAVRVVGAVSSRAICGSNRSDFPQAGDVGSPEVGCHFLDGIPGVRQSGAMQVFSDEVYPTGRLGSCPASLCPNLFWQREG